MGRSGSITHSSQSASRQSRRASAPERRSVDVSRIDAELGLELFAADNHVDHHIAQSGKPRGAARMPHELLIADLEGYLEHEREYTLAACEFGCRYLDAHAEDYTLATAIACRLAMAHGLTDLAAMQHLAEVSQVVAQNDSLKQRLHDARQAVLRDFGDLKDLCDNVDPIMSDELELITEQTPLIAFVPLNGCNREAANFAHTKLKDKIRARLLKIHRMTNAAACPSCGAMLMGQRLRQGSVSAGAEDGTGDGRSRSRQGSKGNTNIQELEAKLAAVEAELAKEKSRATSLQSEATRAKSLQDKVNAVEAKLAKSDEELRHEKQKREEFSQHLVTCLKAGGLEKVDDALSTGPSLVKMVSGHCELLEQLLEETGRAPVKAATSTNSPGTVTGPPKSVKEQLGEALAEIERLKTKLSLTMDQAEVSSKRAQMLENHLRSIGEEVPDVSPKLEGIGSGGIVGMAETVNAPGSQGTGNPTADLRAKLKAARQRITLLENSLRALGAEVPPAGDVPSSSLGHEEDDPDTMLAEERRKRGEADERVKVLRTENRRLQEELDELRSTFGELQAKAQGMQKEAMKQGVGDQVRVLMEESGLDVLTQPPEFERGCRAVFKRLYQDALQRSKRLAIMQQNWRQAEQTQQLAVLEAFSKSVEQLDPNRPGSYLDVDCLCQMVKENLGNRGSSRPSSSTQVKSNHSARMEKAVAEAFIKRPQIMPWPVVTSNPQPHNPDSTETLRDCLRTVQVARPEGSSSLDGYALRASRPATAGAVTSTGAGGPGILREGVITASSGKLCRSSDRPMTASVSGTFSDSPRRRHLVTHIPSVRRARTSSAVSTGSSAAQDELSQKRDSSSFRASLTAATAASTGDLSASFMIHGNIGMPRRHSATNL